MAVSRAVRLGLLAGLIQSSLGSSCNYYSYYGLNRCNYNGANSYEYSCASDGTVWRSTYQNDDSCTGSSDGYNKAIPLSQECDASKDCASTQVTTRWYSDSKCEDYESKGVVNYVYACIYDDDMEEYYTITCSEEKVIITYYKNSDCSKVDKDNIYYISDGCTYDDYWDEYYTVKCAACSISVQMIALLCGFFAMIML